MRKSGQQSWQLEKEWADGHIDAINDVVRRVAGKIIQISASTFEQDTQDAIDYEIKVASGAMACRIRRAHSCGQRDLTMTSFRPSGASPEMEKILNGAVRWYLYAWAQQGGFVDWMFVDLDVVRKKSLIEKALHRKNEVRLEDGSKFVYLSSTELSRAGAIVAASSSIRSRSSTSPTASEIA